MSKPVRLAKQDNNSPFLNKLDDWAMRNAHIILPLCFIVLFVLFVAICWAIIGVSATDSGLQYNQLENII